MYATIMVVAQFLIFGMFFTNILVDDYKLPGFDSSNSIISIIGEYNGFQAFSEAPFREFFVYFVGIILAIFVGLVFMNGCSVILNQDMVKYNIVFCYIQVFAGFFLFFKFSLLGFIMEMVMIFSLVISLRYDRETTERDRLETTLRNLAIIASLIVFLLLAMVISMKVVGTY